MIKKLFLLFKYSLTHPVWIGILSVFSFSQETFNLDYNQYTSCNYNHYTEKYCNGKEESIWKSGTVQVTLTKDSILSVKISKKRSYLIKLNSIETTYNTDNEEIAIFTGRWETNNYILAIGPEYFNFIKVKHWGVYFSNQKSKKEKLHQHNFGKKEYIIKSFAICQYNEENESYDNDCVYKNFPENIKSEIISKMSGGKLYVKVDTLDWLKINDIHRETNNDGEKILLYSGETKNGEEIYLVLGEKYFNLVSSELKVSFSSSQIPEDKLKKENQSVSGSAVAITPNIIITNAHVIQNLSSMSLLLNEKFVKNDGYEIIGEFTEDVIDLAIIKVKDAELNSCPLSTNDPSLGEEVLVYGYPQIQYQGADLKVTRGIVSGKNGFKGDKSTFQIDAAIQHGNSGGPIVSKGKILGLATSMLMNSQNVNFGIKASKIYHLLKFYNIEPHSTTNDYEKCTYLIVGE